MLKFVKDILYIVLGAIGAIVYVSYKTGRHIVDSIPEDKKFIKDTYSQVKAVIKK